MRPLRLELCGFGAFREPATLDFEDVDLMAFVGPTGAGKSTIIDGITFALYGTVTRYDDARKVVPVIHLQATEARVRLDFEASGGRFTAVRVVRRRGTGATTAEARLQRDDGVVLAGLEREMAGAVEGLLGLDFQQFTRTVVLPQGRFAEFLHGKPAERQALLRQLLDIGIYGRVGEAARHRADAASREVARIDGQISALGEVTAEALEGLVAGRIAAVTLRDDVEALQVAVGDGERRAAAAGSTLEDVLSDIAALSRVAVPGDVEVAGERRRDAEAGLAEAEATLAAAETASTTAREAAAGGPDRLATGAAIARLERVELLDAELARLEHLMSRLEPVVGERRVERDATAAELELAEEAHRSASVLAGSKALVTSLTVGEPCPVCERTVESIPDHDPDAELAEARQRLSGAKKRADAARAAFDSTAGEATTSRRDLERITGELSALRDDESDLTLEDARARLAEAEELAARAEQTGAEARDATGVRDARRRAVDELAALEAGMRDAFTAVRDGVSAMGPPVPGNVDLAEDWGVLARWAAETEAGKREAEASLAEAAAVAHRELEARRGAVVERCRDGGLEVEQGELDGLARRLDRQVDDAERRVEQMEESLRLVEKWSIERRRIDQAQHVARELGLLLKVDRFERWLMVEVMADLASRATVRLSELTGGRYALEVNERLEFLVRDNSNAGELRDARTLSGGETFLASLALALALADNVADMSLEGGPRLEAVFLDEGFGSLDPDTLDGVATAIEELGSEGRMVGIVTHIRELADRMPVRYEVRRKAGGSAVERVDA